MQDEQRDIAFWTDASHIRQGLACTMMLARWMRQALPMGRRFLAVETFMVPESTRRMPQRHLQMRGLFVIG